MVVVLTGLIIFAAAVLVFEALVALFGADTRDGKDWAHNTYSR
jgi:hypothetical protein